MFKFKYFKAYFLVLFLLLSSNSISSQTVNFVIPDSLKDYSYDKLYNAVVKVYTDTIKSKIYLNTYFQKAHIENNPNAKVSALTYLSNYTVDFNEQLALITKAIQIAKKSDIQDLLLLPYSFKGGYHLEKGDFNNALENYLLALKIAETSNHKDYIFILKHSIAIIKADIGKNKEALQLFKECHEYELSKPSYYLEDYYIGTLYLSESYLRNAQLDSAYQLIQEGIEHTKDTLQNLSNQFKVNKGIYHLKNNEIEQAKTDLESALSKLNNKNNDNKRFILLANYYLGELFAIKKDYKKSEAYFLKLDSIVEHENRAMPEIRPGFEYLVYYARKDKNLEKQLTYINKLLRIDSIINSNKGIVGDRLFKEFDTPLLVNQKEKIIQKLRQDKKTVNLKFYIALFLGLLTGIFLIFQYRKRRQYQLKFNDLVNQNKTTKPEKESKSEFKSIEQLDLKEAIVNDILVQLDKFENRHGYLKKTSRSSLAKELGTNTKYLSKVINASKNKSFTNYINDLRIDYCVKLLQENKKLRQYTIQGIASEVGFNNAESFSMAFKKSTGLKPSYFIKKLKKLA